MQSELVSRGPLSVLINAELLQFYHSGVWDPFTSCNPTELDHGECSLCFLSSVKHRYSYCGILSGILWYTEWHTMVY